MSVTPPSSGLPCITPPRAQQRPRPATQARRPEERFDPVGSWAAVRPPTSTAAPGAAADDRR